MSEWHERNLLSCYPQTIRSSRTFLVENVRTWTCIHIREWRSDLVLCLLVARNHSKNCSVHCLLLAACYLCSPRYPLQSPESSHMDSQLNCRWKGWIWWHLFVMVYSVFWGWFLPVILGVVADTEWRTRDRLRYYKRKIPWGSIPQTPANAVALWQQRFPSHFTCKKKVLLFRHYVDVLRFLC